MLNGETVKIWPTLQEERVADDRPTDRQTDLPTNRPTDRQIDRHDQSTNNTSDWTTNRTTNETTDGQGTWRGFYMHVYLKKNKKQNNKAWFDAYNTSIGDVTGICWLRVLAVLIMCMYNRWCGSFYSWNWSKGISHELLNMVIYYSNIFLSFVFDESFIIFILDLIRITSEIETNRGKTFLKFSLNGIPVEKFSIWVYL